MTIFYIIFIIFIFLLGLAMGSFINALVYRLYKEKSLWGRSECLNCKKKLGFWDLVPILSFVFLKGKCRYCQKQISWQYPLVEFITGTLFSLLFLRFANNNLLVCDYTNVINLAFLYIFTIILVAIFLSDLKYYIIPDKILWPGVIFGILLLIFKSILSWSLSYIMSHALAVFVVFGFFLMLYLISKGKWIGAGDVKFGILLGLIVPWPQALVMMFMSFVLGAIVGLSLLLLKKRKLKEKVPMGTFLVVGTFITIFFGEIILKWYLSLVF